MASVLGRVRADTARLDARLLRKKETELREGSAERLKTVRMKFNDKVRDYLDSWEVETIIWMMIVDDHGSEVRRKLLDSEDLGLES